MRISDWSSDVCASDLEPFVVDPRIVRSERQILDARGLDRVDQAFGNAAQPEPARAYDHPVEQHAVERGLGVGIELLHRESSGLVGRGISGDRTSVVEGTSVAVRLDLGGGRNIKKKK